MSLSIGPITYQLLIIYELVSKFLALDFLFIQDQAVYGISYDKKIRPTNKTVTETEK